MAGLVLTTEYLCKIVLMKGNLDNEVFCWQNQHKFFTDFLGLGVLNGQRVAKSDNPIWLLCPKRHISDLWHIFLAWEIVKSGKIRQKYKFYSTECIGQSSFAERWEYLQIWNIYCSLGLKSYSWDKVYLLKRYFLWWSKWLFLETDNLICQ